MSRVDFYQLSRDPVETVVPQLAARALAAGHRLLIVADDTALLQGLSDALWARGGDVFLAHGMANEAHADRQPILLSADCTAANDAGIIMLADGVWREPAQEFDRAILLFDASATGAARELWRTLDRQDGIDKRIHKQTPDGHWREGA